MSDYDVRGARYAKETSRTYDITTSDVQDFVQYKINLLTASAGIKEPIKIKISTFRMSRDRSTRGEITRGFYPFLLVLPESAREKVKKEDDADINPVFQTAPQRQKLQIKEPIWKLIATYMYTKNDLNRFRDRKYRLNYDMVANDYENFCKLANLRLIENGKNTYILAVLIDPVRVFRDFLYEKDGKIGWNYSVWINSMQRISGSNYNYNVTRELIGNRRDSDEQIIERIKKQILSDGRPD